MRVTPLKQHATRLLMMIALGLPGVALAQPGERGPGPRGEGEGPPPERREDRPDRERGERDGERWPERQPIPVELVDEALATIREMHPGASWLERIDALVKDNREEAAKQLGYFPRILEMIDARANRPEEFALHIQGAAMMREFFMLRRAYYEAKRAEDQASMDELRPQVREKVEQLFDMRIKMEQMKIDRMKADLAKAEEKLAKVIEGKEAEIDKQTEESLERDWGRRRGGEEGGDRRRERDQPE